MITSSARHTRKQKYSALEILGTVAAVVGAGAAVVAIWPTSGGPNSDPVAEQPAVREMGPRRPDGRMHDLPVVQKNSTFSLATGKGVLLKRAGGEDTFALSELPYGRFGPGLVAVYMNGTRKNIAVGEKIDAGEAGCFVWIISEASLMEELSRTAEWVFEYHCNEKPRLRYR
jgi:hypothetical protein